MRCRLEENALLYNVLHGMSEGYETGDFDELIPYLTKECVLIIQEDLKQIEGYEEVVNYMFTEGERIKSTEGYFQTEIIELLGKRNSDGDEQTAGLNKIHYNPGKFCLILEKESQEKKESLLVDIDINDEDKVTRIVFCTAEGLEYRTFCECVHLYPAKGTEENEDAEIIMSEIYSNELYFFLNYVGIQFDYYDDCSIPLKQWFDALGFWKKYAESDDFDQVLEEMAGIDYTRHTVARPDQAKYMCDGGGKMWTERKIKKTMIDGLMEWTNKYKDSYDCIYCCF